MSSTDNPPPPDTLDNNASDNPIDLPRAGSPAPTAGSGLMSLNAGSGGQSGSNTNVQACAQTATEAEQVPVDMYIMLDRSASMNEATGAGPTKWDAIRIALGMFLRDSRSAGLGVGLQYFPQVKPNVPEECATDAECGEGGPCFNGICKPKPTADGMFLLTFCATDADCPADAEGCTTEVGVCSRATNLVCFDVGFAGCGLDGNCVQQEITGACVNRDSCNPADYAQTAVKIDTLPDNATPLITSLDAATTVGLTPTAAALSGALQHAKDYAKSHADHRVVAVLATDGLPTECEPTDAAGVGNLARDALAATPSVPTYVVGVFATAETEARGNLNTWAAAGGTNNAFIVDPTQDVAAQFLDALDKIRSGSIACEYQLPPSPAGSKLDLNRVNVALIEGNNTRDFFYVGSASQCGRTPLGWHYDAEPSSGKATKIVVCDQACNTLKSTDNGRVEVRVGCETKGPD